MMCKFLIKVAGVVCSCEWGLGCVFVCLCVCVCVCVCGTGCSLVCSRKSLLSHLNETNPAVVFDKR